MLIFTSTKAASAADLLTPAIEVVDIPTKGILVLLPLPPSIMLAAAVLEGEEEEPGTTKEDDDDEEENAD